MTISNSESPSQVAEKSLPSGWLHLVGNFQRNEEAGMKKRKPWRNPMGKCRKPIGSGNKIPSAKIGGILEEMNLNHG
jgi:hypothetical protein